MKTQASWDVPAVCVVCVSHLQSCCDKGAMKIGWVILGKCGVESPRKLSRNVCSSAIVKTAIIQKSN